MSTPEVSSMPTPGFPRGLTVILGVAGALIALLALRELAWLLAPVSLAFMIVLLVHPLHARLRIRRFPSWLALLLLLVAIYAVVIGLVGVLVFSIARLAGLLPAYSAEATALLQRVSALLLELGLGPNQVRSVLRGLDLNRLAGWLTTVLSSALSFGANVIFLLSLLLFIGIESTGASRRLEFIARTRPRVADALRNFAHKSRRFIAVTTLFAVIVGAADTVFLILIGIPLAALWGLLAAVCNYIPYVGFIIGAIPPALLALLGGGWRLMIIVIVVYIVLNSLLTTLLPPYFVGDAVELSMVVTLVSVVFWAWVLGPIGAILAVPLTLLIKALIIDSDPRAAWAQALVGPTKQPRSARWRNVRQMSSTA
jgi:AI-2 transport protein TqsA